MRFSEKDRDNLWGRLTLGLWIAALSHGCGDSTAPVGSDCAAVVASGQSSSGTLRLSLNPGQICTLSSTEAAALEIEASAASAQYLLVAQSGSRVSSARASLRLQVTGPLPAANRISMVVAPRPASLDAESAADEAASRAELRFRANARRALEGAKPLRAAPNDGRTLSSSALRAVANVALGDTVTFTNTVTTDLNVDCDGIHDIVTVVQAMGSSFGILEDVEAAGPVSASDYASVLSVLENSVFPVDTAYFGPPADLDDNGIVWLLFSPVVNRVTRRGSTTRVSGFFNPSDLSDLTSCAGSNQGEILYVLAADPTGRFSDPIPASFATTRAIGVAAHELEHLIAAERRLTIGGGSFADLEDAWLSEGLAHSAETAVGLRVAGLRPGQNLNFSDLTADLETFDNYHFANLRRAAFYLLDTNGTMALGDPSGADPGGVSSIEMRGFSWLFLRWLVDQYTPAGSGLLGGGAEEEIFRDLASGGSTLAKGVANVERVAGRLGAPDRWSTLLARYALAPLADDFGETTAASAQVTSFELRDTYAGLNQQMSGEEPFENAYPLEASEINLAETTNVGVDFDLLASTGRYFVLESAGAHPLMRLTLTTPSGGAVPGSAEAQVVVLRTR